MTDQAAGKQQNISPSTSSGQDNTTPNPSTRVVGIGASAGGLEAIQEFFENTPDNTGLAFVVIQHLSPDHKSLMDELLARYTTMKIHRVEDGMRIAPNSVFLIPPKKNMTLFNGHLHLSDQTRTRGAWVNLPIDIFLRSLAQDLGKNAIGIILSGTGSDGTLGIRAIKEVGGMVMVQDDVTAKFNGMPRSSISTGVVDYVLPPSQMPEALVNYLKHPMIDKTQNIADIVNSETDYISKINLIIREHTGVDFSFYKENTIIRRLEKRISINQLENVEKYIDFLYKSPAETTILFKELLIGVTRFFRDAEAFNALEEKVLPQLLKDKNDRQVRIWSVGCSTGEEAYSLAMVIHEYLQHNNLHTDVKIFATDLEKESIEYASAGIYPESIVSDVKPEWMLQYFKKTDAGYQISESIRKMVIFASHNVLKDPPFSKIDLITCRNLLIYFKPEYQKKILSMFYYSLTPSGFLFLGSSESLGELSKGFNTIDTKWKLFQFRGGYKPETRNNFIVSNLRSKKHQDTNLLVNINRYGEKKRLESVFEQALLEFLPASAIVNENYEIVHTLHNVNQYLTLPTGQVNLNILKMVPDALSVLLGGLLRRAKKEEKPLRYENISIAQPHKHTTIDISATYVIDKQSKEGYFIIAFYPRHSQEKQPETMEKLDVDTHYSERLSEMEKELQYTKESWQATVEELETSNEELQSSNEELIASNEELQSTNEELQSVNEELYTVNAEHQNKIDELTQLHNDLSNLLKYTDIGSLFLDERLLIRKFTPIVSQITNIRDTDIGRPIQHIALDNLYDGFINDIQKVFDKLSPIEKEIQDQNDNWYLLKIIPYRTQDNKVEGINITFININQLKNYQYDLLSQKQLLTDVLNSSPLAKIQVDSQGQVAYYNQPADALFHFESKNRDSSTSNCNYWLLYSNNKQPLKDNEKPLTRILEEKKEIELLNHYLKNEAGQLVPVNIYATPKWETKTKEITGAIFTIQPQPGQSE